MKRYGNYVLLPVTYWGGREVYLSRVKLTLVNHGHYAMHIYVNGEEQDDSNLVQVGESRTVEKLLIYDPVVDGGTAASVVNVDVGNNGVVYGSEGFWVMAEEYSVKEYVAIYKRGSLNIQEL